MILFFSIVCGLAVVVAAGVMVSALRRAPVGYEDAAGFQTGAPPRPAGIQIAEPSLGPVAPSARSTMLSTIRRRKGLRIPVPLKQG